MRPNAAEADQMQPNSRRLGNLGVVACVTIALLLTGGCHPGPSMSLDATAPMAGDSVMVRTELYLGLSKPGGGEIATREFDAFVDEIVTPRFPDGLTIVDAEGQWRGASGKMIREKSKLLIVLHPAGAGSAKAVEEIRSQYKSRFGQESVMRVTSAAGVAF